MALGTRSYGNSLLLQNVYIPENLPNTIPVIKKFATKILRPEIRCVQTECGTKIGRLVQIPEFDAVGLINLEDNSVITIQDIDDRITSGIYTMRVRDTAHCISKDGFCRNCGRGYYARQGIVKNPSVGDSYILSGSARSFQNYVADSFSGSLMGWLPSASDPLPTKSRDWSSITSHSEMDALCNQLSKVKVNSDELKYLYTIEDLLERALAIIGIYGVYASA